MLCSRGSSALIDGFRFAEGEAPEVLVGGVLHGAADADYRAGPSDAEENVTLHR